MVVATIQDLFSQTENHAFSEFQRIKHFKHSIEMLKFWLPHRMFFQLKLIARESRKGVVNTSIVN